MNGRWCGCGPVRPVMRLVAVLAVLALLLSLSPVRPSTSAAGGDGGITIRVWNCPAKLSGALLDAATLAAKCTTPARGLTFELVFSSDQVTLTRSTDYPTAGSGAVGWEPPFGDRVTIRLTNPPAGMLAVVFCDQGSGPAPVVFEDGTTLLRDFAVPSGGIVCQWYLLPTMSSAGAASPVPSATPTAVPTSVPTATATPVPTRAVTPAASPSPVTVSTELSRPLAIRELPPLEGDNWSRAYAINDDGVIVGFSAAFDAGTNAVKGSTAVVWLDRGRRAEALPALSGFDFTYAVDLNNAGEVIGNGDHDGRRVGILWRDGVPQELGSLAPGDSTEATDINDAGQVVGRSNGRAFLWDGGTMTDLGTLPGTTGSWANGINGSGLIVGGSGGEAVLWGTDRVAIDLQIRGEATGVNDAGMIVVVGEDGNAYLVDAAHPDDAPIGLGALPKRTGTVWSLGNSGIAVGSSCRGGDCDRDEVATIWQQGRTEELGSLLADSDGKVWDLRVARDVNAGAVVVGWGTFGSDGARRGYVAIPSAAVASLTPVDPADEPAPEITVAGGTFAYGFEAVDENGNNLPGACYAVDGGVPSCDDDGDGTVAVALTAGKHGVVETRSPDGYEGIVDQAFAAAKGGQVFLVPHRTQPSPVGPAGAATAEAPPRELQYRGEWYLRDAVVPIDPETLTEVTAYKVRIVYGRMDGAADGALYIAASSRAADGYIRYLPEHADRADVPCAAEDPRVSIPSPWTLADGSVFVFAGFEVDVPVAALTALADNVFYEGGSPRPLPALYVKGPNGLERWLRLDDATPGLLDQLAPGLSFAGQPLSFRREVQDRTGVGRLVRVGCAGPFRVDATVDATGKPFTVLYIEVGGRLLEFAAELPATSG